MDPASTTEPDPPAGVVVVVDVANLLGSRPDGWWRDRKAAATRMLERLDRLVGAIVTGPDGDGVRVERLAAVLEGAARTARPPGADEAGGPALEVVDAERDGDSTIVAVTEDLVGQPRPAAGQPRKVLVVTADRGLRRRLPSEAVVVGPDWLNRLIGR